MSAWAIAYIAGVLIVTGIGFWIRNGDEYTEPPIPGVLLSAVLWPFITVVLVIVWLEQGEL